MRLIDADKFIEKLKEHKSLFCKNRVEFIALSDKDKARVDEIDTCIAELVNAEEVPHAQLGTNLAEVGTDCISREQAIEALSEYGHGRAVYIGMDSALRCIEQLPPVQSETAKRIVGKSKDGMTLWYQCDMCNEPVDAQDNFCRECGRRLIDE